MRRSSTFDAYADCDYTEGNATSKVVARAYVERWMAAVAPHSNGGSYINFIDPFGRKGADLRYHGANVERLRAAKRRWNGDPNSALRFPMMLQAEDVENEAH